MKRPTIVVEVVDRGAVEQVMSVLWDGEPIPVSMVGWRWEASGIPVVSLEFIPRSFRLVEVAS